MEAWKVIPGTDGHYSVSSLGRVRSHDRVCHRKNGVSYVKRGIVLKPQPNSSGYMRVQISTDHGKSKLFVHRLVAEAFLENTCNGSCVNHKDFDPRNNAADNLEWVSQLENVRYSLDRGRYERTAEWRDRLKKSLDAEMGKPVIGRNLTTGEIVFFAALNDVRSAGFQPSCVCNCCKGIRSTHKGFEWNYADEWGR